MTLLKKFLDRTFLTFLVVGVVNTLFGTAIMFLAYNVVHLGYWVSSMLNYVLGSILSYFLNKHFTFRYGKSDWRSVARFAINIAVCYGLAYGIAKPLVAYLLRDASQVLQDNGAMVVGMGLFVILNYCGQRFFAFRKPGAKT